MIGFQAPSWVSLLEVASIEGVKPKNEFCLCNISASQEYSIKSRAGRRGRNTYYSFSASYMKYCDQMISASQVIWKRVTT